MYVPFRHIRGFFIQIPGIDAARPRDRSLADKSPMGKDRSGNVKFHAIKENHLFQKAYKGGVRVPCPTFTLYVLPDRHAKLLKKQNPQKQKINRIGISTSKKIGTAVQRSRVRRILRAGLRAAMDSGTMRTGFLIVLSAREAAVTAKSTDTAKQLSYALRKAGLLQ